MTTLPTATNPPLVCWNCHERTVGTHFCNSCGKVLQVPGHSDYFAMFEIPRKLWIEMGALEQKFLQLSWKLHPDNSMEPVKVSLGITDHAFTQITGVLKGQVNEGDELIIRSTVPKNLQPGTLHR